MQVISCKAKNFASYKSLDFTFDNQGLTLISGPTGSGKSTLCDVIPWTLFSRTAKDGAADDVLSWNSTEDTQATVTLIHNNKTYSITRIRGKTKDLYIDDGVQLRRGKDINDTQKLINSLLGTDLQLYLSGAYYHEFSQTAQFFTTTAKNRRTICEQLVDLTLAKTLQTKVSEEKKIANTRCSELETAKTTNAAIQRSLQQSNEDLIAKYQADIQKLETRLQPDNYFQSWRQELLSLKSTLKDEVCETCGNKKDNKDRIKLVKYESDFNSQFHTQRILQNQIKSLEDNIKSLQKPKMSVKLKDFDENEYNQLKDYLIDLETLSDIADLYRAESIKSTIKLLEYSTNKLLSDFYDGEIKISFEVTDADKLDVLVYKNGNTCSYSQLSKGQRQLLKLSFGISVMKFVQSNNGIYFNCLFIDEGLEGLDENMKVKTYRLLESTSQNYSSLFVVDHSESLKAMFTNKFEVSLEKGDSNIYGC